jgi:transmembrane sensor
MESYNSGYKEYLCVGKLADSLTAEENQLFNQLMENHDDFQRMFLELNKSLTPSYLASLKKFKEPEYWPLPHEIVPLQPIIKRSGIFKIAIAATIFLVIGTITVLFFNKNTQKPLTKQNSSIELQLSNGKTINLSESKGTFGVDAATIKNTGSKLSYSTNSQVSIGTNTLQVPAGMDYQLVLADGSTIWLNSTSTIHFPFSFTGKTREVTITGEAYIQVAKNKQQPFIVHLPGSAVKVLGTEFNVNTYDSGKINVALVEGGIELVSLNDSMQLAAGQLGVYIKGRNIFKQPFNKRNTLSWMQGIHYFDKSSVNEITELILRWYGVETILDNSRNNQKEFVGILNKKKPLKDFLKTLQYVADINSYFDDKGVLHLR